MNGYQNGRRAVRYRVVTPEEKTEEPEQELPEEDISAEPEEEPDAPQLIATNRTVCLTCTLAAMMGLFAAFLLYAEKESYAIRHNAVQSVALSLLHLAVGLVCLAVGNLAGGIPLFGFVAVLACYLIYFATLVCVVLFRVRLMLHAWRGERYEFPGLGHSLEHFV